jgi:hypothetical protein
MPCGVSGEWCHAAARRLPEWSRGVRASFAWCWRCGQSGDGVLCTLDVVELWGYCVRGCMGACVEACVGSGVGWDATWVMLRARETVEPTPCLCWWGESRRWIPCLGKAWRCDVYSVCHVVLQASGASPLYIASKKGHVECVRAVLGAGAAVNQATVGCARSMARRCGGTVCGGAGQPALRLV